MSDMLYGTSPFLLLVSGVARSQASPSPRSPHRRHRACETYGENTNTLQTSDFSHKQRSVSTLMAPLLFQHQSPPLHPSETKQACGLTSVPKGGQWWRDTVRTAPLPPLPAPSSCCILHQFYHSAKSKWCRDIAPQSSHHGILKETCG